MAQLNNLIVTGSSRFLNKVYFSNGGTFNGNININNGELQIYGKTALMGYDSWLRINEPKHFTSGIYCGNGILRTDGEFQVGDNGWEFKANSSNVICGVGLNASKGLTVSGTSQLNNGITIKNAGVELYGATPFIDFHCADSNNDYTSRIIEWNQGVLSINGVNCSSSNLAANNVSATNVNVSSRINADAATAIFNNVYVKDELRSTTWAIDNITNLGSTFYVSPCIIFTNPSVYINSKSGTTVTLTITDNNIISSTIGGQTWTSGSKIKLMGRINTSVLGVVNGTMARQLNTTTAKTAYITLNFATTDDCAGIEQGKTYSGSAVGDLKMMMYEVNLNVNGTTKNRPVGIRMSSYNEDKKSSIDIYNGTVDDGKPIVRMGYLGGLPAVNGENPTGYGFYAVGNAFFSGRIVSGSGKIGGFSISQYTLVNKNGDSTVGISSTVNHDWAFWAGAENSGSAPFRVGHGGQLYATNANITGVINANSGRIGNCSIENGRLVLGDTMNYANLNANTYGNYGFTIVADGNNNPWFQHSPQRDILISPVDYNSYKCNGGEWFRIEFEFASTVQATATDNYGANTYVNINIGLYGIKTNGASCWFIPFGGRSNSSGTVQKVSTAVQLDSDVRSFSVCIQCAGSGTFSGTLKIRNVSVYRMMGNELIVDGAITAAKIRSGEVTANAIASNAITSDKISAGAITADKIKSGEVTSDKIAANAITSDKISANNIEGTNGWINLRSGTFSYNDGALAWNGSTMTIGGFKISKYKIINDAIGICSTAGQEWAFWAGASSGGNAPFHVGHDGSLYASNATIGGIIRAKQSISVYNDTFATYQDVVKWDGSNLSIGLVGNAGSTGVNGAKIAFSGSQISVGKSSIVCASISGTNSSFTNVWVENFTNASTFKENITCNKNLKVKGDLTFADYQQDTLATAPEVVYRRPIASAGATNARVAFLQGVSGNKISIRAQYGKSDFTNATFTASSSDVRLKKDIKDSSVNALSKIMQMQIREFNWKQTGVHQELGCVADELELIDPLLTVGGGYDKDGTMNIKSIDTLLLSEYAIKGIQELYKQNKQQQKRIEYLESQLKNK